MHWIVLLCVFGLLYSVATAIRLVAQAPSEWATGSGWAAAGLLSLVLGWLFFRHFPAKDQQMENKDKQIMALIDAGDKRLTNVAGAHESAVKALASAHEEVVGRVVSAHQAEMKAQTLSCQAEMKYEREQAERHYGKLLDMTHQNAQVMTQTLSRLGEAIQGLGRGQLAQQQIASKAMDQEH